MIIEILNEYEFNFENITKNDFHNALLEKNEIYKRLINRLEDYERTYTEFNIINIFSFKYNIEESYFEIIIKVNDLLAYNKNPFYYKKIIVRD